MSGATIVFGPDLKSLVLEKVPVGEENALFIRDIAGQFPDVQKDMIAKSLALLHRWREVHRKQATLRTRSGGTISWMYWRPIFMRAPACFGCPEGDVDPDEPGFRG